ncbi:MAG: winged helix-turn-helix domain-containing protein [Alphaproteobacteria bacterium]|nr:winged helix-turn-helix domain-containing protein [Alphaproteobacteria bacterium]
MSTDILTFGRFQVLSHRHELLADGQPVKLGSRAFDILVALIERAGQTISKGELLRRVWPGTVGEEAALRVHVAALRKALGDGRAGRRYIANHPGRGYAFIAPVTRENALSAAAAPNGTDAAGSLPAPLTRIVGREKIIAALTTQLARRRFLTIVGPGGIGKTTVAVAVADRARESYKDGAWFVGLAPLSDPDLVPSAVSAALGILPSSGDHTTALTAWLRDKTALVVLDSCEHVIGAAASLAEALLKAAPGASILTTSREPLRAESEALHRLGGLELPSDSVDLAAEALRYSAVQLFNERAAAAVDGFTVADADVPAVLEICRRLDGIPLALELAAARVDVFGVRHLAAHLDDRFRLLTSGRRTALPRQQTLRATIDWSYGLLPECEKVVLRRLAVFRGDFTMEAASSVVADEHIRNIDVIETVANLSQKSLVATDVGSDITYHYMFDTMQAYAVEKLNESGETTAISRRHAEYYCNLIATAPDDTATDKFAGYAREIDNIRAALTWAFSPGGDTSAGVRLAAASTPVWLGQSLLSECLGWTRTALEVLGPQDNGTRWEMVLQCALGYSLMFTEGLSNTARAALHRARELAESLQDVDYQLRALAGLASCCHRLEDFQGALDLGRSAETIANNSGDPGVLATADWILGTSLFFLGEYREASSYAQRTRERTSAPAVRRAHLAKLGRDSFVSASCTMAQALWAQGLVDQSARLAQDLLFETQREDHPLSLCLALTWCGCQIPLWLGDLETAGRSIAQLKDHAEKYRLSGYYAYGCGFEAQLFAKRGNLAFAERLLRFCLESLRQSRSEMLYTAFLTDLAEVLAKAGRFNESLVAAAEALQRTERNDAFWWMPEALRIKGEILAQSNPSDPEAIEDCFTGSLARARRHGALSWELRTTMSLARLWQGQRRLTEAHELLGSVYNRFTEGFAMADLQEARRLLHHLQ